MSGHRISEEQRRRLDKLVLDALAPDLTTLDDVVSSVVRSLVAMREPWAVAFARNAHVRRQVEGSIYRWRDKGRVARGPNPRVSAWRLVDSATPTRLEMIQALVDQVTDWDLETLLNYAREHVRACLDKLTDDQVAAQYRESME